MAQSEEARLPNYSAQDVLDDATKRASVTRRFLEDNEIGRDDFLALLRAVKVQPADESHFDLNNDSLLTTAVLGIQEAVGLSEEDTAEGRDGKFGRNTLAAVREFLERNKEQAVAAAALASLHASVERLQVKREVEEGPLVSYRDVIQGQKENGIINQVIQDAERECQMAVGRKGMEYMKLLERENLLKLVQFASQETQVPACVILAALSKETGGKFQMDLYGHSGELGMGQFMPKTWKNYIQKNPTFQRVMGMFTDQDPQTIGRARSIVADLLGSALFFKRAADRLGFVISNPPTREQLVWLRFYYHVPGYAVAFRERRTDEYGQKASAFYRDNEHKYKDFADRALGLHGRL